ncbi:DNA helicase [Helicobacter cinaedi]|uniref:RecB-like helicase n=1 Tax=Helicobacter cinaedi TaxID=213 RepID=UPI001F1BA906|nr:RecB-like helicase [Helicobacter cinaedi]BDB64378.1 DNA helicase [Helicobacter cinaedi]
MQEQFLALKASAGSGKTFSLSLRFIYLLFQGANPHQILTLTFTKKASNEMYRRIYEHLKGLLQSFETGTFESNDIYKALLQKGLSYNQMSENIAALYHTFMQSSPRITTIDSFFHSVLKKFCWYVGVSSRFEIGEIDKGEMYEMFLSSLSAKEIKEFVEFCFTQGLKLQDFLAMLYGFSFLPHNILLDSCYDEIDTKGLSLEQITQEITINMAKVCDELKRQEATPSAIKLFSKTFDYFTNSKSSVKMLTDWDNHSYLKKYDLSSMESVRERICGLFVMYYHQKQRQILLRILHYLTRFKNAQQRVLKSKNVLDFESVSMKNYELLTQNIDREFFYFRLDEKITHILLDEFQDTSCMQYQILRPIIDEIQSGNGRIGDRSVFIVGDEKQSIYMFRGSFSGVFEEATKALIQENLEYNYRSSKRVIDFNNATFSRCFENYINQAYPHTLKQESKEQEIGFVRVFAPVGEGEKEAQKIDNVLVSQVVDELGALLGQGADEDDIAILVFKNNDILTLKESIQAQMPHLNIVTETNSRLFEKKEVKILLYALKCIVVDSKLHKQEQWENDEKKASLYRELKLYEKSIIKLLGESYFGDCVGESSLSHPVLHKLKSLHLGIDTPPSQVILALIEELDLAQSVSWRFLELSCEYRSIEEFLQEIPSLLCNAPTQSNQGVKIMTIHKSKGLEFKYVILCDRLGRENNSSDRFITEYHGASMSQLYYKMPHREVFDIAYNGALQSYNVYANQEKHNVLYVAFTRAKCGLSVMQKSKGKFEILGLENSRQFDDIPKLVSKPKSHNIQNMQSLLYAMPKLGEQDDFVRVEQSESKGIFDSQSWRNIIFGNALHSVFELHLGYEMSVKDIQSILFNRYGFALTLENIQDCMQKAMSCMQSVEFKNLLESKMARCEVSYKAENRLYRMDTLLYDEKEWIVLDYKSATSDEDSHKQQVREYMEFLRRYGKDKESKEHKQIRGFIVYPLKKQGEQLCEVSFNEMET